MAISKQLQQLLEQHQGKNFDYSNFCSAPFVHQYIHSNEAERLCCSAENNGPLSDTTELNLANRWSSAYQQDIRTQFLNNQKPAHCRNCFNRESTGGKSDRMMYNERYIKDLKPNVKTGNEHNSPIDLDIRAGNLCNLKCRMCTPLASSQLQKEAQQYEILHDIIGKGDILTTAVLEDPANLEFIIKNTQHGKRIKFLGGEPTIMPEVDQILDWLIKLNYLDVPLHFTTNCTNNAPKFINKIRQFHDVSFNYSIDGVGSVLEYIRAPVRFDTVKTVLPQYQAISKRNSEIHFTLQALNLFNVQATVEWADSHNIKVMPELLRGPRWASVRTIPWQIRQPELQRLCEVLQSSPSAHKMIPVLKEALDDPVELATEQLADATRRFDQARDQHIRDYIPEIWHIIQPYY
jgi:sulfatase maturation enzyme AslB (radical SAM superfamily)